MDSGFPVPSRDVTNQTLPGREKFNYSRPGRLWSVTSRYPVQGDFGQWHPGIPSRETLVSDIPVSRPGRLWSVTSRLRTGKPLTFFYSTISMRIALSLHNIHKQKTNVGSKGLDIQYCRLNLCTFYNNNNKIHYQVYQHIPFVTIYVCVGARWGGRKEALL